MALQNVIFFEKKSTITFLNIKIFAFFAADLQSMSKYLLFETNARIHGQFIRKWQAGENNFEVEMPQKRRFGIKNGSLFNLTLTSNTQELKIEI